MKIRSVILAALCGSFTASLMVASSLAQTSHAPVAPPDPESDSSTPAGAYMIVLGEVTDRAAFMDGYAAKLPPLYEKYGGNYLALGRGIEVLEGRYGAESYMIAEWESMEAARAFWHSPEYQALKEARKDWARFDVLLIPALPVRKGEE